MSGEIIRYRLEALRKGKERLLLEQLESDLGDNAFEDPAGLLVQLTYLLPSFCLSRELGSKLGFKDAAEQLHPWGHSALKKEVGRDFNLK